MFVLCGILLDCLPMSTTASVSNARKVSEGVLAQNFCDDSCNRCCKLRQKRCISVVIFRYVRLT